MGLIADQLRSQLAEMKARHEETDRQLLADLARMQVEAERLRVISDELVKSFDD
jgi:hypothetical protein